MRNLYHRIVAVTVIVMVLSTTFAFFASNLYYQFNLKPFNDRKITAVAKQVKIFYEEKSDVELEVYLNHLGQLGYQFYLIEQNGEVASFGEPFRDTALNSQVIQNVLSGSIYHGIAGFPPGLFITGFFDNTLTNSIGTPITGKDGQTHALFIRPSTVAQFGEMRSFFALMIIVSFLLSIALIAISTRYVFVKPIVKLTAATQMLARGKYNIKLNLRRSDEIGRLAKNFTEMARGLEQLEAMRQEFVSNVSHEIQSPLASIQGFSHTLLTVDLPEEQRRHYLSIIEDESRRISQLSKQLLMLASLEKEESLLEKNRFELGEQIRQVLFMTEWNWREKGLAVKMELPQVFILGDSRLLHQVWINLITNSIKFTDEGGTLSVRVIPGEKVCTVEIADTGSGIAEEDLPHIFERFYRADKTRSRKEGSSGLGLAIVSKIVDMHEGSIDVKSRSGEGTTFRITLPLQ